MLKLIIGLGSAQRSLKETRFSSTYQLGLGRSEALTLRLTRAQRKALFAGEHPRIALSKAEVDRIGVLPREAKLSSKVVLKFTGVEASPEEVNLLYVVKDDRPRLLRARTRSAGYEEGLRNDLTGAELVKASEASAYTHSPGAALRGSGEEVSRADQERYAKESNAPALQKLREDRFALRAALDRIRDNKFLYGHGSLGSELRFAQKKLEKSLSKCEARINGEARRVA